LQAQLDLDEIGELTKELEEEDANLAGRRFDVSPPTPL
jgi:hypothetical protein